MKFKEKFRWLEEKPLILLFAEGIAVDDSGLFGGVWSPSPGGGFRGTGIAQTTFRKEPCMGWAVCGFISGLEIKPDMIGFSHTPGAMQKWSLEEIFE